MASRHADHCGVSKLDAQHIVITWEVYSVRKACGPELEWSCSTHSRNCSANASPPWLQYEPELFPGLVYHMKDPKVVLLIFVTGKVVITGAASVLD